MIRRAQETAKKNRRRSRMTHEPQRDDRRADGERALLHGEARDHASAVKGAR
jgi:hypothetical protein